MWLGSSSGEFSQTLLLLAEATTFKAGKVMDFGATL